MRLFGCARLSLVLLCAGTTVVSSPGQGASHASTRPKRHRHLRSFQVVKTGNASCLINGHWRKVRRRERFKSGVEIVTGGLPFTAIEGDQGQVMVTIYPDSHVLLDTESVELDPHGDDAATRVTIDEDLSGGITHGSYTHMLRTRKHKGGMLLLSTFKVYCRVIDLTLGGNGTSYTVSEHFNDQKVLDGMQVWENDTFGSSTVWSYVKSVHKGTLGTGKKAWVDSTGKFN